MIDDIHKPRLALIVGSEEDIALIVRARNLISPEDYQDYCKRILDQHAGVSDRLEAVKIMSGHFVAPKPRVTLTFINPLPDGTVGQILTTVKSLIWPTKLMYLADEFWIAGRDGAADLRVKNTYRSQVLRRDELEAMAVSTQLLVEARRKAGLTKVEQGDHHAGT